jgi:hypothetical protein
MRARVLGAFATLGFFALVYGGFVAILVFQARDWD